MRPGVPVELVSLRPLWLNNPDLAYWGHDGGGGLSLQGGPIQCHPSVELDLRLSPHSRGII